MFLRRLLSAVLLVLAATGAAAQTIIATGHPNWPPFSSEQGGLITGVGADVARQVFHELGLPLTLRPAGNWKRAQAEVAAGKVDLLVACYRTAERARVLSFPLPAYADDANVVWVKAGKTFPFRTWDDLIGRTGTAMLGESYGQRFDAFIADKLHVERVSTPRQNFQKLLMGRADYYPFSLYGGQIQARELGYETQVEHLPTVLSTEGVYLCLSKKSPLVRYLPQIERILARMRADGSIDALLRQHLAPASHH